MSRRVARGGAENAEESIKIQEAIWEWLAAEADEAKLFKVLGDSSEPFLSRFPPDPFPLS